MVMQSFSILEPVFALATLTFLVLRLSPSFGFMAAFAGKVGPEDLKLGGWARVPTRSPRRTATT
jgi:hypothetical protein